MRPDVYHAYSGDSYPNDLIKPKENRNIFKMPFGVLDDETTNRAMFWRNNGEIGLSSLTMWMHLLNVKHPESDKIYQTSTPLDSDDFRRCYLLLEAVPEWKNKLEILAKVSPVWENLIKFWNELILLFEEHK